MTPKEQSFLASALIVFRADPDGARDALLGLAARRLAPEQERRA